MKAKITVELMHTVGDADVPEKTFVKSSSMNLEVPLGKEEFLQALDTLITANLTPILKTLCESILAAGSKYYADTKKAGAKQLLLPF